MKQRWPQVKLADVILDIKDGGTPSRKNPENFGGNIYWCVVKDIKPLIFDTAEKLTKVGLNNCSAKVWPVDSVVISLGATVGKIGIAKVPTATKQGLAGIVVDKQKMIPEFLAYGLIGQTEYIQSLATGATIKEIRPTRFASTIRLPVPPLTEQRRIVSLLDEAFSGLATAEVNAKKNLQKSRDLFERFLQSVVAQRGSGWVEATIGEVCTLRSGTTVSPILEKPAGEFPYLKVADMTFEGNEDRITTSSRFLRKEDVKEGAVIPKGATIFPKRGGAILTNKKRITSLPICADLNIMAVIPSAQIDAGLLYFYFLNVDMRKLGTGSSIPQINNYDIAPLRISFPKSLAAQEGIVSKLSSLREETQRLARIYERKVAALKALKKSLLHEAFSGRL